MRKKNESAPMTTQSLRPALTPEARENQMIALAVNLAEKQLQEGTASSQVITHYLKLGSTKYQLEKTNYLSPKQKLFNPKKGSKNSIQKHSMLCEITLAMGMKEMTTCKW